MQYVVKGAVGSSAENMSGAVATSARGEQKLGQSRCPQRLLVSLGDRRASPKGGRSSSAHLAQQNGD